LFTAPVSRICWSAAIGAHQLIVMDQNGLQAVAFLFMEVLPHAR
jgi:hypothetical protein